MSDVLVVPSTAHETWGLVVNEAMAAGLPAVVSSAVGCVGSLVLARETGEVFPEGDAGRLASHLAHLAADPGYREQLATRARCHVEHFDVSVAVTGTLRALRAVTAHRHGGLVDAAPVASRGLSR